MLPSARGYIRLLMMRNAIPKTWVRKVHSSWFNCGSSSGSGNLSSYWAGANLQAPSSSPRVREKSDLRQLPESFSGRRVEVAPSGKPKLRPLPKPEPDMRLMIPTQTEIIANHDRPKPAQAHYPYLCNGRHRYSTPYPPAAALALPSRELTMPRVPG